MTKELKQEFYYYEGSLTTPTCDEVVNWVVMKRVLSMSNYQLGNLTKCENNNFRVLKSIYTRPIYYVNTEPEDLGSTGTYSVVSVGVSCVFAFIIIFI